MSKNKIEIVVARYNENLDWLKLLPKNFKITVYNKGLDDIDVPSIKLPNVGRESHTYLQHIISNYDNLSDKTIFCQGDSIFHNPDFIELVKNYKDFEPVQPLASYFWKEGVPPYYISIPPVFILDSTKNLYIKDCHIHVEYLDNDFIAKYPYYYPDLYFKKFITVNKKSYNVNNILQFNIDRFMLKNVDISKLIPTCYAGLIAVNRDVIRENSIDFYNNIKSILIYDVREGLAIYKELMDHGQMLEKLWLVIFNYKKHNKNYIDLDVNTNKTFELSLNVKNKTINFKMFLLTQYINLDFNINDIKHFLIIESRDIKFKKNINNKTIFIKDTNILFEKNMQNVLKSLTNINVKIIFENRAINVYINNLLFFNYEFNYNITNISEAKIFDLTSENNLKDIN